MLKPEFSFRLMKDSDLDAIMAIEPVIYSHPWSLGNFTDSLTAGHIAWVMLSADAIIGYSVMMPVLDEAHLLNISIAQAYQQRGLGYELLKHMLFCAKATEMKVMLLEVRSTNVSAIALYAKMGFVEDAIRKGYYQGEHGREDAVLMSLAV